MGLYWAAARPVFFALPPEGAHRFALRLLGLPLPWARIGGAGPDPLLATAVAGIPLANPIGLAAGFDKTGAHLDALGLLGFGYVVGGTFTCAPRTGNPKPRIVRYRERASMVNAMGLPNPGAEEAARTLARVARTTPRFASVADEAVADAVAAHALLEPHVDAIELNASCPNVSWGRDRDNEAHLSALLSELVARRTKPIFVKLPPFHSGVEREVVLALARIAQEAGVEGLTCSNTRPVADAHLSTGTGGLSGRALSADTPRIVGEVRAATGAEMPVNACGGVFSAEDALACLEAGAATVQVYTGLVFRGPRVVGQMTRDLASALRARRLDLPSRSEP